MVLASTRVMDALKGIGLNLYERRLWVALLARGTSTAGELSEIANVPRSRAYDVLQSLVDKGFVIVQTGKPIRYVAVSPEDSIERVKKKMEENIQEMQQRLDELKTSPVMRELKEIFNKGMKIVSPEEMTGAIRGRYSVMQQLDTMFSNATKNINIVTTPEWLSEIITHNFNSLKSARERGVEIKIATNLDEKNEETLKALGAIAEVRCLDEKEIHLYGRFAVVDGKEMFFGLVDNKTIHSTQDIGIWSRSEHASGDVLEPLFKLVWEHSKPAR
jgi:sugar-specific transcriptional regulator TrmB